MRYQQGTIEELQTSQGSVWFIRFCIGTKRPRFRIGTKAQYPTRAKASRAAQHIRDEFNSAPTVRKRTFGDLVDKYELEEMPDRYSTRRGYMNIHRNHITPKWGAVPLEDVSPMVVRAWILGLKLSGKTRGNILGQMRVLFRYAMLWEWIPAAINPMSLFSIPGSTKRMKKPRVISPAQFRMLIKDRSHVERTMIIGAYCLGLRVSELFGLKWGDFDHLGGRLHIQRAIVDSRVGNVKTERSEALLPLSQIVNDAFLSWRQASEFKADKDWVFASPAQAGELPLGSKWIQQEVLRAAGKAIGLDFNLGWHTFRHSYKVLLERAGADITVQRDLMRHSDVNTTLQIYGSVEMDRMKLANDKAVALAFREDL